MIYTPLLWLRRLASLTLSLLLIGLLSCKPSLAQPISPQLEQQVLEIIRNNPEVLVETLQRYQTTQAQAQQNQRIDRLFANLETLIADAPTQGDAESAVVLLEFSDFQCPFCGSSQEPLKAFLEKHPELLQVFKHFPLNSIHPQAVNAALAAWAAHQQGAFWAYHDRLFAQQSSLSDSLSREIAQSLGLDLDQFNSDRNSPEAVTTIQQDMTLGQDLGIQGTPLFVLYDRQTRRSRFLYGVQEAKEFEAALEQVVGHSTK